jgi:hypothetical protein
VNLADLVPLQYRTPGFTTAELAAVEDQAGVRFPPDLGELLRETVPTGPQFPEWRTRARESVVRFREQVIDGFRFGVIQNDVWLRAWGERPDDSDVGEVIAQLVRDAPALIPVYGHRAIPSEPPEAGNPVFSIVQTDVMIFGSNLREYLINEFKPRSPGGAVARSVEVRTIRFWDSLLDP